MMDIVSWIFMSVLLIIADGFTVRGASAPLAAPLGSSVVLPCYVEDDLLMTDLEVEWRRKDSDAMVHFYQDGESQPDAQQQDYYNRAHFFTDEFQRGNFSLRLDDLKAEDKGEYTCKVYIQLDSGETVVEIKDVERLLVLGSNQSVSAYCGEDVTLNCSVDSHIKPEHFEVSWKKKEKDGEIMVLLYQNNKTLPEASHEQYIDRVEFFSSEIHRGNFSLRLKNVRTEDKGVYICEVFAGNLSAIATVVLGQLGFSSWHIAVLFLCFAAVFGALLLFCSLIYCRSKNTVTARSTIWKLQISLVFFPNICLSFAFILWGFTEGSLHETVTCSALYILRPIMLIWALSNLKYLQGNPKPWMSFFTTARELAVFTVVVYSVLFLHGWRVTAHDTDIVPRVFSGICFGGVVVSCLILSTGIGLRISSGLFIFILAFSQLFQLLSSFGVSSIGYFVLVLGCPVLMTLMLFLLHPKVVLKYFHRKWVSLLWMITIALLEIIIAIYANLIVLEIVKDWLEWICIIVFLEVLKMIMFTEEGKLRITETSQQGSNEYHLCNEILYMFGAVGVVLLSSLTLTAELILKARNGERFIKDLRFIIFPDECAMALCLLLLQIHISTIPTGSSQNQRNAHQRHQPRSTVQNHEMEILSGADSAVSR